jgi:hypothetical protein
MKTFTGQKKLIAGSGIQLLLNYHQENLFIKSCYIYKSAYTVRKKIEAFFLPFFFVVSNLFFFFQISKYQIKIKFT